MMMATIYRLPDELLLQITAHLRAKKSAAQHSSLRQLCLVSKKLLPIAQEQLYTAVVLPIPCGCHPGVNAAVQLLRTLLDRPKLACQIKGLRFSIVRRKVGTLYQSHGFDLCEVRGKCLAKLTEYQFAAGHPWRAALQDDFESAYGGVLLSLLPNLDELDFAVKDHHRGYLSVESISALFVTSYPPVTTVAALAKLRYISTADLSFLRDIAFTNLKTIHLKRVDVRTALQLNGSNTLRGATQLGSLSLELSIQLLDEVYMHEMQVCLGDVFDALGCQKLAHLSIVLSNDAYPMGSARSFCAHYFTTQLELVSSTLRKLEIDVDPHEDGDEWSWFFGQCIKPIKSLDKFQELQQLKVPQEFLFKKPLDDAIIAPANLPRTLQRLDIVAPDKDVEDWARRFWDKSVDLPDLKILCLRCREGLNSSKADFAKGVSDVWVSLEDGLNVSCVVCDIADGVEKSLKELYAEDPDSSSDETDGWDEYDDDSDDDDESLPALESVPVGIIEELLVDGVD
jgi:hypothetical protein